VNGAYEEDASEDRKRYLRENREKVRWLYGPPSWWNNGIAIPAIKCKRIDSVGEYDDTPENAHRRGCLIGSENKDD
jgi:hypothetical protein